MIEPTLNALAQRLDRLERWWKAIRRVAVVVLVLPLPLAAAASTGALAASHTAGEVPVEVQRYLQGLEQVCETRGITPELVRLHQEATKALDAAKYGRGRGSNFWGLRTPEHAYHDCFQADGAQQR